MSRWAAALDPQIRFALERYRYAVKLLAPVRTYLKQQPINALLIQAAQKVAATNPAMLWLWMRRLSSSTNGN